MKIMSFNIWFGGERPLGKVTSRRLIIQEVIKQANPDILGLLECNGWTEDLAILQDYERALGMKSFLLATKKDHEGNAFNIAFLIKPELKVESVFMDTVQFWHGIIIAKVKTQSGLFTVAVTHLNPHTPEERLKETEIILELLPKENCILMGDLNSLSSKDNKKTEDIPSKYRDRHITNGKVDVRILERFEQAGFIDSFRSCHPRKTDYTAPTPVANDPAFEWAQLRLDYLLVSKDLVSFLLTAGIVKTKESKLASDHFPILIELK